jgi:hypothetical protein
MQAQRFLGQLALNPTGGKTPTDGAIPVDAKIGGIRGDFTFRGGKRIECLAVRARTRRRLDRRNAPVKYVLFRRGEARTALSGRGE